MVPAAKAWQGLLRRFLFSLSIFRRIGVDGLSLGRARRLLGIRQLWTLVT